MHVAVYTLLLSVSLYGPLSDWPIQDRPVIFLIQKHPFGCPVEIFILITADRPEERHQPYGAHPQGDRYQPSQRNHRAASNAIGTGAPGPSEATVRPRIEGNLNAFATTRMEESDMATAAMRGVT